MVKKQTNGKAIVDEEIEVEKRLGGAEEGVCMCLSLCEPDRISVARMKVRACCYCLYIG